MLSVLSPNWQQCIRLKCLPVSYGCEPAGAAYASTTGSSFDQLKNAADSAHKKGNKAAEADALYNLAKAYFESSDNANAEQYMRQCLAVESGLKRPDSAVQAHVALAGILSTAKRIDDAIAEYKTALALARDNKLKEQASTIVNDMGTLALVSGRYDDAEQLFKEASQQARAENDSGTLASALVNLAVVSRARNNNKGALNLLNEALAAAKDSGDDRLMAAALMERGRTQSDLGQNSDAIATYKQALEAQKGQLDDISAAKSALAIGQIYLTMEKYNEAESSLKDAQQTLSSDQNTPQFIDVLIALGGAEAGLGHFDQAKELHKQALERAGAKGDRKRVRTIFSELGYDSFAGGQPEDALEKYVKAYNLLSEQDPTNYKQIGIVLTDIAMSLKAVGQVFAAIANYEQAVDNFSKANDTSGKATALDSLAVAYLDNGMLDKFESTYKQAKDIFAMLSDKRGEAILDYNFAQYHLVQGRPAEAVPLYESALASAGSDNKLTGQIMRGLGLAYLYLGRSGKALECYQKALPAAEESGNLESQWECQLGLGKSYKALGQISDAVTHLRIAADLVEKERSQFSKDSFKTYNLDLRQDCFSELVDALVIQNQIEEALVVAEKGRARAFLDLLEGRKSRHPGEEPSSSSRPSINIMALKPGESGSRGIEIMPRATTFVEASTISPINAQPPTLEEIKALVSKSNSTFVEYYVLPGKVLAWIIHPDGAIELATPPVISRKSLTQKITDTYKAIIAHPKTPAELGQVNDLRSAKLRELASLLVDPVLPYLPKAPDAMVTIVPHGPIFSVPFAALTDANGRFMVEDHTLSYIPAIGVLRATQKINEETKTDKDRLLAFGNPITKQISFLGALPYSEKEVRHVAELFGADRSTVKVGADANKGAFGKLCTGATVIHLATHGLVDEEHPMDSALVLAPSGTDDGLLTVKDILQLPELKTRLVVLSACQTARGKITGDGVVGLSRSFIIAGTPSILVSQWNVDDVITEFQMETFYKTFLGGAGKGKSLREAQLKTIALLEKPALGQTKSVRANPRYWAAFQLIGEDK
jgi:CHAT domain-containing protein/tetratricopeptide (TPR) repeat protein